MDANPAIAETEPVAAPTLREDVISSIAPGREERIFLLLSIFIGIISGLLVVSFRMAIEWLSVLLLGSSPNPHQPRLLYIPAAAGLVIAVLTRYVFPNVRGSGINQTKAALYINNGYISFRTVIGKFLLSALAIGSGHSLGPDGPLPPDRSRRRLPHQPPLRHVEKKAPHLRSHRSRRRTRRCLQRSHLRHPL